MSLGLDVPVLLSDLAAHSSVSCPTAWVWLFLAAWTLLFPWEYTDLFLGQTSPAFGSLWFFCLFVLFYFVCFPPFAIHLARSSLPRVLCCCPEMWWHCGVPFLLLPALPCPGYWEESATCACRAFHVQILNDQEKDLGSLPNKFTIIFWICLLTPLFFFLVMRRGQREVSFSPVRSK